MFTIEQLLNDLKNGDTSIGIHGVHYWLWTGYFSIGHDR